jgi:hypothetical protein
MGFKEFYLKESHLYKLRYKRTTPVKQVSPEYTTEPIKPAKWKGPGGPMMGLTPHHIPHPSLFKSAAEQHKNLGLNYVGDKKYKDKEGNIFIWDKSRQKFRKQ